MKKHTKIYLEFNDEPICELCGKVAVDIHHIESRGMGGSNKKDVLENLMALCRNCHLCYGDIKRLVKVLQKIHLKFLENKEFFDNNVSFEKLEKYDIES